MLDQTDCRVSDSIGQIVNTVFSIDIKRMDDSDLCQHLIFMYMYYRNPVGLPISLNTDTLAAVRKHLYALPSIVHIFSPNGIDM